MKKLLGFMVMLAVFALGQGALAETKSYALPNAVMPSSSCIVSADEAALPVMDTAVNLSRIWTSRPQTTTAPVAWLELDGDVDISVQFIGQDITSAIVRPLSLGITPAYQGDTVTFTLDKPAQLTVEINDQQAGALHLFAEALRSEEEILATTLCFEAGLHEVGTVTLQSGQSVYLASGAVVRGQFLANDAEDIRIYGRGILDGSQFHRWDQQTVPIDFVNCKQVSISDITILDPAAWTLNLYLCEDVTIDHVKIIGARSNSDGITLQSCKRVAVSNCFVRGWDDNLVVKGYDGDVSDISFTDCVLWTDLAQSCEIGYETRADVIENITFENITVLHANHKPVCSIHNSDNALVQNIVFRNIVVEDCQLGQGDGAEFLIDLTTTKSQWSKSKERGNIRNVLIENVTVLSGKVPAFRIFAINKDHTVDHVTIKNLSLMGEVVESFDQLRYSFSPRKLGEDIVIEP
ncbi:MAG: hypothetical protein GX096_01015 [Clostridiales bacterium]|nr:hypothetical protein [Clostridiales bacterium]